MNTRLMFATVAVATLFAGAAAAQGRPGGAPILPPQAVRPTLPVTAPPSMRPPMIAPPSNAAASSNVGAGISGTARSTRSGEAVRTEARALRSATAGSNANASANANANAGFTGETSDDDGVTEGSTSTGAQGSVDTRTDARSRRQGADRADDRGVERSNDNAGLRTDAVSDATVSSRDARAVTAELNRLSAEGSAATGVEARTNARANRQEPARANAQGRENADQNSGLRDD
ncbi:MAG: hypothetical protein PSV23_04710 [Brevundimonas sp.]|uniref:hypothetical protein n=1 Tax=Brevundimonas sp. TaxID=1871086 RepID=UPI00248705D2|nr:hypothetical protein [Brevundimonas sp.]MDI1326084.1 hypothetical protein [Brevundimonas sp.]